MLFVELVVRPDDEREEIGGERRGLREAVVGTAVRGEVVAEEILFLLSRERGEFCEDNGAAGTSRNSEWFTRSESQTESTSRRKRKDSVARVCRRTR